MNEVYDDDLKSARVRIRLISAGKLVDTEPARSWKELPMWRRELWHKIARTQQARFYR